MDSDREDIERLRRLLGPYGYRVRKRFHAGGMGTLWLLESERTGEKALAKEPLAKYREHPQFRKQFVQEVALATNLKHPNIVTVYTTYVGAQDGSLVYTMEHVEGTDLHTFLRERRHQPLELSEARAIVRGVAAAAAEAHRQGVVHCDIKPSNILIENDPSKELEERVKLADFGIARALDSAPELRVIGSVRYMAPERFDGQAEPSSDVYSIGVVYYELLTGRVPFTAPSDREIRDKHKAENPAPPEQVNPHVAGFEDCRIVMRCLEKWGDERFPDAGQLLGAMRRLPEETVTLPASREVEGASSSRSSRRRRPGRWRVAVAVAVLLLGAGAFLWGTRSRWLPPALQLWFGPGLAVEWAGLRVDPLDTPRGIAVAVRPLAPRYGTDWQFLGTLRETGESLPRSYAWYLRPGRFEVRLSDTYFRAVAVAGGPPHFTVERGARRSESLRLAPTSFAGLYQRGRKIPFPGTAKPSEYINAILDTDTLDKARCLGDVEAAVQRARKVLKDCGEDAPSTGLLVNNVASAVLELRLAGQCLADGETQKATWHLEQAAEEVARLPRAGASRQDFLFQASLEEAAFQVDRLRRQVEAGLQELDREAGFPAHRYLDAAAAMAHYTALAPGKSAFDPLDGDADGGPATEEALKRIVHERGLASVPAFRLAREYRQALDELLDRGPPSVDTASAYHQAAVDTLDQALSKFDRDTRRAASVSGQYLHLVFSEQELGFRSRVAALWRDVHQRRLVAVASRALAHARQRLAEVSRLPASEADAAGEVRRLLGQATSCAQAVATAGRVPRDYAAQAATVLARCRLERAVWGFLCGPATAEHLEETAERVREALGHGPRAEDRERLEAVQAALAAIAAARGKLQACVQANFPKPDHLEGGAETLHGALHAAEELTESLATFEGAPVHSQALRPFHQLQCGDGTPWGGTLWEAAACWFLARATEHCRQGAYRKAYGFLAQLDPQAPGTAERRQWVRRLPRAVREPIVALRRAANFFDNREAARADWKAEWDSRLRAEPFLDPVHVPEALSPGGRRVLQRTEAVRALLLAPIQAEQTVRSLEAELSALIQRNDKEEIQPHPDAASPERREAFNKRLKALFHDGAWRPPYTQADHLARLTALSRCFVALNAAVQELHKSVTTLDQLDRWKKVLKDSEQRARDITDRMIRQEGRACLPDVQRHRDLLVALLGEDGYTQVEERARTEPVPIQPEEALAELAKLLDAMTDGDPAGPIRPSAQATPQNLKRADGLRRRLRDARKLNDDQRRRTQQLAERLDALTESVEGIRKEIARQLAEDPQAALAQVKAHKANLGEEETRKLARRGLQRLATTSPPKALEALAEWREPLEEATIAAVERQACEGLLKENPRRLLAALERREPWDPLGREFAGRALTRVLDKDPAAALDLLVKWRERIGEEVYLVMGRQAADTLFAPVERRAKAVLAEDGPTAPKVDAAEAGLKALVTTLRAHPKVDAVGRYVARAQTLLEQLDKVRPPTAAEVLARIHARLDGLSGPDGRPHPRAATPEAIADVERDLAAAPPDDTADDKRARQRAADRLGALKQAVQTLAKSVESTAKADPLKALDQVAEWQAVLGKERAEEHVALAVGSALAAAEAALGAGDFARAQETAEALRRSRAVRDHGSEEAKARVREKGSQITAYCQAQALLREAEAAVRDVEGRASPQAVRRAFEPVRDPLKQALGCRDAARIQKHLGRLLDAAREELSEAERDRALAELRKAPGLHPSLRLAANKLSPQVDTPQKCVQEVYRRLEKRNPELMKPLFADPRLAEQWRRFFKDAAWFKATQHEVTTTSQTARKATVTSRFTVEYKLTGQETPLRREQALVWSLVHRNGGWLVESCEVADR